ncbi:translation initiation factor eIF-2B subunit family protein [Aspergillus lucknowensis]|uniref:Nudix hydrolase domain-containing protein n=1 Tax=Aspergillus lucknowensis TaxID=176173 RepID=A0ABR4M2Z7_9EURO
MAAQVHNFQKRAVVSSFIFQFPNGPSEKPLVALFKRSDKVSTYRHRIAPISGSISRKDKNPLTAAWREISEETKLTPSTLAFWRTGKPFSFVDESVGREWTIHAFAFRLKASAEGEEGENAIETDWEHEGWQWYDPSAVIHDEIFESSGVPHLRESLRRVWFEGEMNERTGKGLGAALEKLHYDHESGSHELTAIALKAFRDFVIQSQDGMNNASWWEDLRMAAWHLVKNGRESMGAATLNALLVILEEMDEIWRLDSIPQDKLERMLTIIDHHLKGRNSRAALVTKTFASYVQSNFLSEGNQREKLTLLTLSASSTIRDSVVEAYASLDIPTLELRILESRPLFEGVSISSSILSNFQSQFQNMPNKNLVINIYTDAAAALAAKDVDIVLLGADRISRSKGVSNKIGSLPLALSVKHVTPTAKVVVLSELEKVNGENGIIDDQELEDNDPTEVTRTWNAEAVKGADLVVGAAADSEKDRSASTVSVRNVYFEWVPLALVDAFVSGEGVLTDARIHEKANQQEELASQYIDSIPVRY